MTGSYVIVSIFSEDVWSAWKFKQNGMKVLFCIYACECIHRYTYIPHSLTGAFKDLFNLILCNTLKGLLPSILSDSP